MDPIDPPEGAQIGERITFEGHTGVAGWTALVLSVVALSSIHAQPTAHANRTREGRTGAPADGLETSCTCASAEMWGLVHAQASRMRS